MQFSAILLAALSVAGASVAAPSPAAVSASASNRTEECHTGAEIVAKLASFAAAKATTMKITTRQNTFAQDPEACYADCVLAGGKDWECICKCVDCGGNTPPPPRA